MRRLTLPGKKNDQEQPFKIVLSMAEVTLDLSVIGVICALDIGQLCG